MTEAQRDERDIATIAVACVRGIFLLPAHSFVRFKLHARAAIACWMQGGMGYSIVPSVHLDTFECVNAIIEVTCAGCESQIDSVGRSFRKVAAG